MAYDPKPTKFPFPKDTASHYITVKTDRGITFDKDYPYIDRSRRFAFRRGLVSLLLHTIVFPVTAIRLGLKIKGRENLKKNKDVIKNGVVSCCNHVHFWDYLAIMRTIKPSKPYVVTWARNINGESGTLIRLVGGIPVPENDIRAARAFGDTVGELLNGGGWLHVYAEGSMWEYYRPIRPFKNGAAYFACKYEKPLIPLAFSYREPGFIRRKIFRQTALFTLNIGQPLYADKTLPKSKQVEDLLIRSHGAVCALAGFEPGENIYPPVYKDSKRIDYYPLNGKDKE